MTHLTNAHFLDDTEKMRDFKELSKERFLESYSYLTEEEYNNTKYLYEKQQGISRFVVIEDLEGGSFGMNRAYTPQEWRQQVADWLDGDCVEDEDDFMERSKDWEDEFILDYVMEGWFLGLGKYMCYKGKNLAFARFGKGDRTMVDLFYLGDIENDNPDFLATFPIGENEITEQAVENFLKSNEKLIDK